MPLRLRLAAVVAAALLVLCVPFVAAGIRCTDQSFANSCPNSSPVCCILPPNNDIAGCCPMGTVCEEATLGCRNATPLPPGEKAIPLHDMSVTFHLSVGQVCGGIAAMLAVGGIAFGVLFGLHYCRVAMAERRERRRRAAERRALEPSDDESVGSGDERSYVQACTTATAARRAASAANRRTEAGSGEGDANDSDGDGDADERRPMIAVAAKAASKDAKGSSAVAIGDASCVVCRIRAVDAVLMDCAHSVTCHECAQHLKRCPACKTTIRRRKKFFLV